jgi:hypothetical protein
MSGVIAVLALALFVVSIPVIGAALFSLLFLGLFGLALVGVLGSFGDRSVRHHDAVVDPKGWRNGS